MAKKKEIKKQGADNSNEFFKNADTSDVEGIAKYSVDLGEDELEKISVDFPKNDA